MLFKFNLSLIVTIVVATGLLFICSLLLAQHFSVVHHPSLYASHSSQKTKKRTLTHHFPHIKVVQTTPMGVRG